MKNKRRDVVGENKFIVKLPVEKKIEPVLWVIARNALHCFISVPPDAFELVFQQKAGVDGDIQWQNVINASRSSWRYLQKATKISAHTSYKPRFDAAEAEVLHTCPTPRQARERQDVRALARRETPRTKQYPLQRRRPRVSAA